MPWSQAKDTVSQLIAQTGCTLGNIDREGFQCSTAKRTMMVRFTDIAWVQPYKKGSQWCVNPNGDSENKLLCWSDRDVAFQFAAALNRMILERDSDSLSMVQVRETAASLIKSTYREPCRAFDIEITRKFIDYKVECVGPSPTSASVRIALQQIPFYSHVTPMITTDTDAGGTPYTTIAVPQGFYKDGTPIPDAKMVWYKLGSAVQFAEVTNRLKRESTATAQAREAADEATFMEKAAEWRAMTTKPPMPEEARVHKVLAENAVEEKNAPKAIKEFEAALAIYPTWPIGQFNLAMLYGEGGDYTDAVQHMQDYLILAPDAPDAQAAKDKIIIWQDKLNSAGGGEAMQQAPPPPAPSPRRR
jgi:tetratricopeptide (TPR) repeat protein